MTNQKKICPNCQGNGFVKTHKAENPANDTVMKYNVCNSKGEVHDKEFDEYFDPLLLSHCTTTDFINVGAAFYVASQKPNPVGAI